MAYDANQSRMSDLVARYKPLTDHIIRWLVENTNSDIHKFGRNTNPCDVNLSDLENAALDIASRNVPVPGYLRSYFLSALRYRQQATRLYREQELEGAASISPETRRHDHFNKSLIAIYRTLYPATPSVDHKDSSHLDDRSGNNNLYTLLASLPSEDEEEETAAADNSSLDSSAGDPQNEEATPFLEDMMMCCHIIAHLSYTIDAGKVVFEETAAGKRSWLHTGWLSHQVSDITQTGIKMLGPGGLSRLQRLENSLGSSVFDLLAAPADLEGLGQERKTARYAFSPSRVLRRIHATLHRLNNTDHRASWPKLPSIYLADYFDQRAKSLNKDPLSSKHFEELDEEKNMAFFFLLRIYVEHVNALPSTVQQPRTQKNYDSGNSANISQDDISCGMYLFSAIHTEYKVQTTLGYLDGCRDPRETSVQPFQVLSSFLHEVSLSVGTLVESPEKFSLGLPEEKLTRLRQIARQSHEHSYSLKTQPPEMSYWDLDAANTARCIANTYSGLIESMVHVANHGSKIGATLYLYTLLRQVDPLKVEAVPALDLLCQEAMEPFFPDSQGKLPQPGVEMLQSWLRYHDKAAPDIKKTGFYRLPAKYNGGQRVNDTFCEYWQFPKPNFHGPKGRDFRAHVLERSPISGFNRKKRRGFINQPLAVDFRLSVQVFETFAQRALPSRPSIPRLNMFQLYQYCYSKLCMLEKLSRDYPVAHLREIHPEHRHNGKSKAAFDDVEDPDVAVRFLTICLVDLYRKQNSHKGKRVDFKTDRTVLLLQSAWNAYSLDGEDLFWKNV